MLLLLARLITSSPFKTRNIFFLGDKIFFSLIGLRIGLPISLNVPGSFGGLEASRATSARRLRATSTTASEAAAAPRRSIPVPQPPYQGHRILVHRSGYGTSLHIVTLSLDETPSPSHFVKLPYEMNLILFERIINLQRGTRVGGVRATTNINQSSAGF